MQQVVTLVSGDLSFTGGDGAVGMRAKENFAEAFAGEEARRSAFELYFFKFLAAFTFEFRLREAGFASKFVYYGEQLLGKFRKAGESDGAAVGSGAGGGTLPRCA